MSKKVPEWWTEDLLTNLVATQRGTEPGSETYCGPDEGVRFLRIGDLSGKTDNPVFTKANRLLQINSDDILFALDGSPGLVAKGYIGAISSGIRLIKPKNQKVKKDFIFYALQSPKVQSIVKAYTTGSTILHAGRSLQFIAILLPPLPEQRKIAIILSSVDNAIEKTKAVIEQTKVLKKGLMQELLTRGIPGRHKKFKKTPIGMIPEEWEVKTIKELVCLCEYGLSKPLLSEPVGIPILRMNNLNNGEVDTKDIKYVVLTKEEEQKYILKSGDLLFNRTNSRDLVGKVAIYRGDKRMAFASYLLRLRPKLEDVDSRWLNYYFNTDEIQDKLRHLATPGVSQSNINAKILQSLKFRTPPLKEQKEISDLIEKVNKKINQENTIVERLNNVKSALMQVLLTGEVRVKPIILGGKK